MTFGLAAPGFPGRVAPSGTNAVVGLLEATCPPSLVAFEDDGRSLVDHLLALGAHGLSPHRDLRLAARAFRFSASSADSTYVYNHDIIDCYIFQIFENESFFQLFLTQLVLKYEIILRPVYSTYMGIGFFSSEY